jgi:hypothetical protein
MDPVRRNARVGPVKLPAGGRKGEPPAWPLPGGMDGFEEQAWRELWATPQAAAWEAHGWSRVVARYCRVLVEAEQRGAKATARNQATLLEDRLGLTPKAMRLLLWTIAEDEVGEKRTEQKPAKSARGRIKAVG